MNMISAWFLLGACLCLTRASSYNPYNSYQPSESIVNMPPQSVSGSSTDSILDNTPDMCLRNPCLSGLICRSVPPEHVSVGFICVNPNDSDASQVYKNMDLLYQKAIMDNVENIAAGHHDASFDQTSLQQQQQQQGSYPPQQSYPQEQPSLQQQQSYPQQPVSTPNSYERSVSLSLKVNKPMNLTCEQMKCQVGERCVATPNTLEGVICVRERITVVQQENAIIDKLNRDEKFQADTAVRCKAALSTSHQRLDIPGHPTLYVDCMPSDEGKSLTSVIITCTDNLVFNKFLDRCDIDQEPVSSGCASSPCMFGTTCHEADNLGDYRCDCPPGFSGKNCQIAPDVCSVAPCGHSDGNVCHVLPPKSGLTYFCTCFSGKAYGLSCEEDKVEKNPCEENFQVGSVFSTRIGPTVFGMCDQERQLNLRVCDKQMQAMGECKWLSTLGQQRRRRGAVSAGHLQKRKTPIRKLHY